MAIIYPYLTSTTCLLLDRIEENWKREEGLEQVVHDEGYGSGEPNTRDAHSSRQDKEVVVFIREVHGKGAPKI